MLKHELAQELRERQYQLKQVPKKVVDALSDDAIIDAYITCSHCGEKQVDAQQLQIAILQAEDADHFFEICDQFGESRHHTMH